MGSAAIHEDVLVTLRKIIRRIDLHSRHLVQIYGLTGPQLIVLKELGRAAEMPVGQLARLINLSHGTVTSILDRLAKRGLVARNRSLADKRCVMVSLTEPGIAVLASAPSLVQEQFIERFSRLAEWEKTLILSSLQRVATMMDAEEIDASSTLIGQPLTEPAQEIVEAITVAPDSSSSATSMGGRTQAELSGETEKQREEGE